MDLYYSVLENGCQMFAFKGMNIGKPESTGVSTRTGWVVLTLGVLWTEIYEITEIFIVA